ncbi:hypothetical protein S245_044303, partial [Arachis hypogaea]
NDAYKFLHNSFLNCVSLLLVRMPISLISRKYLESQLQFCVFCTTKDDNADGSFNNP